MVLGVARCCFASGLALRMVPVRRAIQAQLAYWYAKGASAGVELQETHTVSTVPLPELDSATCLGAGITVN